MKILQKLITYRGKYTFKIFSQLLCTHYISKMVLFHINSDLYVHLFSHHYVQNLGKQDKTEWKNIKDEEVFLNTTKKLKLTKFYSL